MLNNTVFITGASRGIGLAIAQVFSREGYFVIGTSRSKFDLENALGTKDCLHMILDVTDRAAIKAAHDTLKENNYLDDSDPNKFIAKMGAECLIDLLARIDLDELSYEYNIEKNLVEKYIRTINNNNAINEQYI